MEFLLTFHMPADLYERNALPENVQAAMTPWKLFHEALQAEGVLRGGNRLDALAGTVVRQRDGRRQVQDGPYADSKDLLGGYMLIDVPSLDDALRWADRCPSSLTGSTQVHPVIPMEGR
jgi:hypothetical protein